MKQPRKRNIGKIILKVILITLAIIILGVAVLDTYIIVKPHEATPLELLDY